MGSNYPPVATTVIQETVQSSSSGANNGNVVRKWVLPIMLQDPTHVAPQIPWDDRIQVGDMVKFTSEYGVPRVVFVGVNPFSPDPGFVIANSELLEVTQEISADKPARAYCWIKLSGSGQYIGYAEDEEDKPGYTVPPPKTGP